MFQLFLKRIILATVLYYGLINEGKAQITASDTTGCAPLVGVDFTGPNNATNVNWDFNDGTSSPLLKPKHTFAKPGKYLVVFTGTVNGNPVTYKITIHVFGKPAPKFKISGDSSGCAPLNASFIDLSKGSGSSTITTWEWAFGDGGFDKTNNPNPTYVYQLKGVFDVTLKVKDSNGCDSSVTFAKYMSISDAPTLIVSKTPDPASSCLPPLTVTFSAGSSQSNSPKGTGLSYSWDFGNSTTSNLANPLAVNYTQKGIYTVILKITDDNNCSASTAIPVSVNNAHASFQVPDTVCPAVTFHNTSYGTIASWDYGDGSSGPDSTHLYKVPGKNYNVKLTVFTGSGSTICFDDTTITIHVQEVIANFSSTPHFSCSSPMTVVYTDQSKNATQWEWHFGNNKGSALQNPTNSYSQYSKNIYTIYEPKIFSDTLYVTSKYGCRDTVIVPNNDTVYRPTARFMPDVKYGCVPLNVTFSDSSRSAEKIISREWIWGDGSSSKGNDTLIAHTYTAVGVYYPKLIIVNSKGCRDTSFTIPIYVSNKPHPNFSLQPTVACPGQPVTFTNLTPSGDSIDVWHYEADGKIMSSCPGDANPIWKFNDQAGPQNIKLTVVSKGCAADTTITNAITIKGPISDLVAKSDCAHPYTYTFTTNHQDVDLWNIDFGDGKDSLLIPGSTASIVHTYTASGDYHAILEAVNQTSGCAPYRDTVVVHARLIKAKFSSDTIFCVDEWVPFAGDSSQDVHATCFHGYNWYFDNYPPLNTNFKNLTYSFPTSGIKKVMLVVTDINNCKDTTEDYVMVSAVDANIKTDKLYGCLPLTINYTDASISDTTLVKWNWKFGDGATDTLQNTSHTYLYAGKGSYKIFLTATNINGCSGIDSVIIKPSLPDTLFSATTNRNICIGKSVSFAPHYLNHTSYSWNFGDGFTSTDKNPTHIYNKSGTYDVRLTVTDSIGCPGTKLLKAYVNVQDYPTAGFYSSADTLKNKCYPLLVNYTDTSIANVFGSRKWNLGNNTTVVNNKTVGTIYPKPGTYTVSLIVTTTFGCSDTVEKTLKVVGPLADFSMDKNVICKGQDITFTIKDTTSVYFFHWDFGDGKDTVGISPIKHPFNIHPANGKTNVTLVIWSIDSSCAQTVTKPISIHKVIADFARNTTDTLLQDTAHCLNVKDIFTNKSIGADQCSWDLGDGTTSSNCNIPVHEFTKPGTYPVRLSIKNNATGCVDTLVKEIIVFPPPHIKSQGGDTCQGSPLQLHAKGAVSYTWTPATGLNTTSGSSPICLADHSTKYTITAIDTNGCQADTTIQVQIIEPPGPFSLDTTIVIGEIVPLNADAGFGHMYEWQPKDSVDCYTCPNTWGKPLVDKGYTVRITDSMGCFDKTFYYKVIVKPLSSIDVPTAFTPDGDGVNDKIYVAGWGIKKLLEFKIYNRWGELLFETNDITVGWDGTLHGVPQNMETYVYIVKAEVYISKDPVVKKGYIQLIR